MNKKEDKDQLQTVTQEEEQEQEELEVTRKEKKKKKRKEKRKKEKNGSIKKLQLSDKITIQQPDQTNRSNRNPHDSASHAIKLLHSRFFIQQQHQNTKRQDNEQATKPTDQTKIHTFCVSHI